MVEAVAKECHMILIVGLGNIGQKYAQTRHNIGFMVLDKLNSQWTEEIRLKAFMYKGTLEGQEVVLAKPTTMMNDSGQSISRLAQHYRIAPENIWVVYDELDLPLGKLKIVQDRGDSGHNGTTSVRQLLGHNRFVRFRIGVDTRQAREIPGLEYVLQPFSSDQSEVLLGALNQAVTALRTALKDGADRAAQLYN
jgi:PTH1 family peptidyl-tRNA hydrolase